MMKEEEKLMKALHKVRRDEYKPFRYMWFTFFNGIIQGLGFGLGITIVFGAVIYLLTIVLSKLVDFPILGYYFSEIAKIIEYYVKHSPKVR